MSMLTTVHELQQELYGNKWKTRKINEGGWYCVFCGMANHRSTIEERHTKKCPRINYLKVYEDTCNEFDDRGHYVIVEKTDFYNRESPYDNGGHPMNFGDR